MTMADPEEAPAEALIPQPPPHNPFDVAPTAPHQPRRTKENRHTRRAKKALARATATAERRVRRIFE